jgi:hypothetical protein
MLHVANHGLRYCRSQLSANEKPRRVMFCWIGCALESRTSSAKHQRTSFKDQRPVILQNEPKVSLVGVSVGPWHYTGRVALWQPSVVSLSGIRCGGTSTKLDAHLNPVVVGDDLIRRLQQHSHSLARSNLLDSAVINERFLVVLPPAPQIPRSTG